MEIENKKATIEKQMVNMEIAGENLMEVIAEMKAEETKLEDFRVQR